jgi:hypothetical protein
VRTLIHEMPYERPLAAGRYRYEEAGQPTGAVETWRLNEAKDGYRFLRVDLNAEEAPSGESTLFHATLDAERRLQRLKFRFFAPGSQITGNLQLADEEATLVRDVDGDRHEEDTVPDKRILCWFPASAGLSLLVNAASAAARPGLTLQKERQFALWSVDVSVTPGDRETIEVMGKSMATRQLTIRWNDEQRTLWLDEHDWPVRVRRGSLTAIETRYLRYK